MFVAFVGILLASAVPAPRAMTTASRTEGVCPLGVFFDATRAESGVVQPKRDDGTRSFAAFYYEWRFGDDDTATWKSTKKHRNTGTGFLAAHVFDKPGRYTVTLRVTTDTNEHRTYAQTITVRDADEVYANSSSDTTENTFYVSTTGNDTQNGSINTPLQTWNHALDRLFAVGGKKRLLCRRGDTFTASGFRAKSFTGPIIIGAYGTGKPPVVFAEGPDTMLMLGPGDDLTISGLAFRSHYDPVTGRGSHPDVIRMLNTNRRVTIYDNTFSHAGLNMHLGQMGALIDSVIAGNTITAWQNYGVLSGHLERVALLGNTIRQDPKARTGDGKHPDPPEPDLPNHGPIRLRTTDRVLISNNNLFSNTGWSSWRGKGRAHQPCLRLGSGGRADLTIVSDNLMEGGLTIAGAGPSKGTEPARTGNVWERNRFIAPAATTRILETEFAGAVIRNNVFLRPDTGGTMMSVIRFVKPRKPSRTERKLTNLVQNNTYLSLESRGKDRSTFVLVEPEVSGTISVVNNLMYAPSVGKYGALIGAKSASCLRGLTSDHNLYFGPGGFFARYGKTGLTLATWQQQSENDMHSLEQDPLLANPKKLKLGLRSKASGDRAGSPAIDAGVALPTVRDDFNRSPRPRGAGWDIGAVEHTPTAHKKTSKPGR